MFGLRCATWYRKQAVGLSSGHTASCIQYICLQWGLGEAGRQHYFAKESGLADPISTADMGY